MSDEYHSIADRQKVGKPRVHSELTQKARERICQQTLNPLNIRISDPINSVAIPEKIIGEAISKTYETTGYSAIEQYIITETPEARRTFPANESIPEEIIRNVDTHREIIENAENNTVLAYIEYLIEYTYAARSYYWSDVVNEGVRKVRRERVITLVDRINTVLETEGVLWTLEREDSSFNFRPVGSELLEQADSEFSRITSNERWKSVVKPYESAFDLYKDKQYTYQIPEKLYNSIEELARTIVVDLQGWEDNREMNLKKYLDSMREHGLFEPNNIMYAELDDLVSSMEKAFQKPGAHRKNRHQTIGRNYSTLLLHQVSAYLTFIIRSYEEQHLSG